MLACTRCRLSCSLAPRKFETTVRYDNERGKGDHRHLGEDEHGYVFTSVEQLLEDFRSDVERWR
jgi:hypothetical protein